MASVLVANGAFKSGSTWIYRITRDLTDGVPPPPEWQRENWKNPSVHMDQLEAFLSWARLQDATRFCFKAHYKEEAQADLLESADARVVDIQRDLRDVFVSAYFHYRRLGKPVANSIEEFYADRGPTLVRSVAEYHELWASRSNSFVASYEELSSRPVQEIALLADWLGVKPSPQTLESIIERHDFARLQSTERTNKPGSALFYRSGTSGDWERYLDDDIARAIDEVNERLPRPLVHADGDEAASS